MLQSKEERQQRAWRAQQHRQRWREQADAEAELDWERYGKYDMLHELLQTATSDPALQVSHPVLRPPSMNSLLQPYKWRPQQPQIL